ncbi:hypothetical protein EBBID32_1140 [Sphingobium indicum BiD32]|uniref:Uncharacterized protein n=1 Tax=Sphingobium indicum BiD32 TaxID=1301087 RepID=N1MFP9_9SPHN|nr:hypothetical protein [Sphingobium indicum]CCW15786.1 hypothetical protein EBBID32_1140 [Sphingobium indicum BiD32]
MKTIAFAAAIVAATLAVSAASTPAFAQSHGSFGKAKVTYDAKTDRYCFRETVTGSLVPVTQCQSKAEWARNGLTISRKSSVQLAQR